MTEIDINELMKHAQELYANLPPYEKAFRDRESKIDFAYGNLAASTNHKVPREIVEKAYEDLHPCPHDYAWLLVQGRCWTCKCGKRGYFP